MRDNLPNILKLSTNNEGGYSNHPRDPGGPTNHGITQGTLSAYIRRPASIADVKSLTLATANTIYEANYWRPINGDKLPYGLDYAVFDFGINSGPSRAAKELQKLLPGVSPDGIIGQKTIDAIGAVPSLEQLIKDYCKARLDFCKRLKTWPTFGRGWTYRVTGVDPQGSLRRKLGVVGDSLKMVAGKPITMVRTTELDTESGKARDVDIKSLAPIANKLQAIVVGGAGLSGVAQFATDYLPSFTQLSGVLEPYKDTVKIVGIIFTVVVIACGVLTFVQNLDRIRGQGSHA